jgi:hypothetical protein
VYRIPITLQFRDGESVVSAIHFPKEPALSSRTKVCQAAADLGKSRGAVKVLVPRPWGKARQAVDAESPAHGRGLQVLLLRSRISPILTTR